MYIYTLINRLIYTHIKAYTYMYIYIYTHYVYIYIYLYMHTNIDDFGTFQRSKFGCVLPDLEQFMSDWLISSDLTMGSISFGDAPLNQTTSNPQS